MHNAAPPLNALRAFEAAARHLSLTKAALELNVTPGALSHQIRGLEDHLGLKLFDRGVRSIALTAAGKALQPGLQAGFLHIRDALASLNRLADARVLVISAPPGFTSKWLAPRLYRFSIAYPEIDVRVSSSINNANFTTDGVDAAVRNLRVDAAHCEALEVEKLIDHILAPVCSPAFVEKHGPFASPDMLKRVPLIHDESLASRAAIPTWADWFAAAGVRDAEVSHGLRFSSADHALDATVEGARVLLAPDALAYDDLRTGRLVMPFDLTLPSGRCYAFVCPKKQRESANVRAFRAWLREEAAALDWSKIALRAADFRPAEGSEAAAVSDYGDFGPRPPVPGRCSKTGVDDKAAVGDGGTAPIAVEGAPVGCAGGGRSNRSTG